MRCSEVPRGPRAMLPPPPSCSGPPPHPPPHPPRPTTHHHQPPSEVARALRVFALFFNQHLAGGGAAGGRSVTPRSAGRPAQVVRRLQRQAQPAQPLRACGAGAGFIGSGARVAKEEVCSLCLGLDLLAVIPIPGEVLAQCQSTIGSPVFPDPVCSVCVRAPNLVVRLSVGGTSLGLRGRLSRQSE